VVFSEESQLKLSQLHLLVSSVSRSRLEDFSEANRSRLEDFSEANRNQLRLNHQVSLEAIKSHQQDYLVTLNQLK